MSSWIDTEYELPPCNGVYEVLWDDRKTSTVAYYNGYGFIFDSKFLDAKYWRPVEERRQKRYGKLEKTKPSLAEYGTFGDAPNQFTKGY